MGNLWYKLSSHIENNNRALYNYLQDYYDHNYNKYTFIIQLKESNNGVTLYNPNVVNLTNKVIEFKIDVPDIYTFNVHIKLNDVFYCKTGIDRYKSSQESYNLINNMNWFDNFNYDIVETDSDIKSIKTDDISYRFMDFLLDSKSEKTLPLFRLLCFIKNIDETKFI